jgi:hypothetical protein
VNPPQQSPITNSPISNYGQLQQLSSVPTQPQPAQPQQGGNFLERLLPTIGGVGGGILGSLVAPVLGTAAGSGLGEAAGKAAENALTGQNITSGVGSDLVSGAASGLLGAGLGKVAEGAGGLLSKYGENAANGMAESDQATQAANQVAQDSELQSAHQAAETADKSASDLAAQLDAVKTANKAKLDNAQASAQATQAAQAPINRQAAMSANYGSILPKVQKLWNLGPNQDFVNSMGFDAVNPYDMQTAAQAGTDLNGVVDSALQGAPTVNLKNEISSMLKESGGKGLNFETTQTPLGRALQASGIDETNMNVPAPVVRNLMQNVGEEIGNSQRIIEAAKDTGQNPIQEEANLQQLSSLYDGLRKKLSNNPAVNDAIKNTVISPEQRQAFVDKYGPKLGDHIATTITEAKNYDDIVPAMQKFAQMNRASKAAIDDIEKARSGTLANKRISLGASEGGPAPGVQPVAPAEDLSAQFKAQELELQHKVEQAQLKAQQLHDKADMLGKVQSANNNADELQSGNESIAGHIVNAAGHGASGNKAGALTSLVRAAEGASPAVATRMGSLLNRIAPFVPPTVAGAGTLGGLGGGQQNTQEVSNTMQPPQANPIDSLFQANMAQNILAPGPYGSSSASMLGTIEPQVYKGQQSQAIVNNALGAFQGAGGAQGFGGGMLSKLSGMIPGTAANAYEQRQAAAAAQLAQLLGISPEQAMGMLPQLMQSAGTGAQTAGGAQSLVGALPL